MSTSRQDSVDDEGLAGPRTSLAWWRTALACTAAALACLRFALTCRASPVTEVLTVALAVVATVLAVVVVIRTRRPAGRLKIGERGNGWLMLATSLLIATIAVAHVLGTASGC